MVLLSIPNIGASDLAVSKRTPFSNEPVPFPDVTEKPRGRGREDGNWEDGFWAIGMGNN